MPYVQRNENGKIVGVFAQPQSFATEFISGEVTPDLDYKTRRAAAYPALSEFADAFYWLQQGDNSRMETYLEACRIVKETIPSITESEA